MSDDNDNDKKQQSTEKPQRPKGVPKIPTVEDPIRTLEIEPDTFTGESETERIG